MRWTPEQRTQIAADAVGKVVESLDWDAEGNYWAMTFTDSSEICFRFMAEPIAYGADEPDAQALADCEDALRLLGDPTTVRRVPDAPS